MKNFISYGKQWIDEEDIAYVTEVLRGDYLTQGPYVTKFEEEICRKTGAKYCLAVANGTIALHLAALSLDIEAGKEGITTPNTFVASANCMAYSGITPKFIDIDRKTYNIDANLLENSINKNTKLIVAVDFAGQPADMKKIYNLAKEKGIYTIEDAAHSIGSKYPDGQMVGSNAYSDITTFSFHPVKTITTGEGGAITTNNDKIYEKLKLLRTHGITKEDKFLKEKQGIWYYEMQELGFNGRITDIQAALGITQLKKLDIFAKRRREIVDRYNKAFAGIANIEIPFEENKGLSVFHLYVLKIDFEKIGKIRNDFMLELKNKNIGTQVHYIPVHTQPYYRENFGYKLGDFPVSEEYYKKALSIPLYPKMTDEEVDYVIENIIKGVN